jgi:hypothetical protein
MGGGVRVGPLSGTFTTMLAIAIFLSIAALAAVTIIG